MGTHICLPPYSEPFKQSRMHYEWMQNTCIVSESTKGDEGYTHPL